MSCRGVAIRIDESTDCRVIIAGLEVIEAAFGIVIVASVAEGVLVGQFTGGCQDLAVGVVGVGSNRVAAGIHQALFPNFPLCIQRISQFLSIHTLAVSSLHSDEISSYKGSGISNAHFLPAVKFSSIEGVNTKL